MLIHILSRPKQTINIKNKKNKKEKESSLSTYKLRQYFKKHAYTSPYNHALRPDLLKIVKASNLIFSCDHALHFL